jgi:hypothetical protein
MSAVVLSLDAAVSEIGVPLTRSDAKLGPEITHNFSGESLST